MIDWLVSLFGTKSRVFDSVVVSFTFGGGFPDWQERKNSSKIRIMIKAVSKTIITRLFLLLCFSFTILPPQQPINSFLIIDIFFVMKKAKLVCYLTFFHRYSVLLSAEMFSDFPDI